MLTHSALLLPSSPTLLIDAQRGSITEMLTAFSVQAERFAADAPDAIVVATSRWPGAGAFLVDDARHHRSLIDLPGFGVEPRFDCAGSPALARAIVEEAHHAKIRCETSRRGADTGVTVPLSLLMHGRRIPVVPVSLAAASAAEHRAWGAGLHRALAAWEGKAAFAASGCLTFHEHSFNLRREVPEDRDLDGLALAAFARGDWRALSAGAAAAVAGEKAHPEAGWHHLEVLRGFLTADVRGVVRAYETLPGISEALVEFPLEAGE